MKVLVTGGCGFLGSHVCELFKEKGWGVVAYDNMTKFETSRIAFGNQERIRSYNKDYLENLGIEVVVADIRYARTLENCAKTCNYIVNCAAQPTMTLSFENPILDFEVNVQGTLNLLEAARRYKIPLASCSSIHVYGTGLNEDLEEMHDTYRRVPPTIDETHPVLTGHLTPLHASKRCAEIYTQTYADVYGIKTANFRLTGIYGPRQFGSEDHGWVSLLAIKTMMGLPIQLIGNGKQARDILYVKDAAKAFDLWHENGCPSGTYNIGGGVPNLISVLQCLRVLGSLFARAQNVVPGGERTGDLLYFACDYAKAHNDFGWKPSVSPHTGLKELVEWLRNNENIFNASYPAEVTVSD